MEMKVTRPFLLGGQRQEIDTIVEIESRADAAMLQHEGKAVPVTPADAVVKGPMTTETVSAMVSGKSNHDGKGKGKGKINE